MIVNLKRLAENALSIKLKFLSHKEAKIKFFKIRQGQKQKKVPIVYPNQYQDYSLDKVDPNPIISRNRPVLRVTQKYQIPDEKMMQPDQIINANQSNLQKKILQNCHVLNIGLIGPVNAGKSQLFGALAYRISAVSPKSATTTQVISGIKSFEKQTEDGIKNIQLKYYDTPGLMYKKQGFVSSGWKVLSQIDFSLLVVDSAKRFDDMTKQSIKRLQKHRDYQRFMKALVLNKVDLVDNKRKFDQLIRQIQKYGKFDKIFYVSAKTGYGIGQLQQYLLKMAKPGEWQHKKQIKTTLTQLQIYQQFLREAIFLRSYKQVPHDIDITCISFSGLTNNKDQIIFDIFVATENQQRMIIGTQGRNMKEIIDHFKILYAKTYQKQAQCIVSVKIRKPWKNKFRGQQTNIVDDQQIETKQKLKILNETITTKRASGNFRKV